MRCILAEREREGWRKPTCRYICGPHTRIRGTENNRGGAYICPPKFSLYCDDFFPDPLILCSIFHRYQLLNNISIKKWLSDVIWTTISFIRHILIQCPPKTFLCLLSWIIFLWLCLILCDVTINKCISRCFKTILLAKL